MTHCVIVFAGRLERYAAKVWCLLLHSITRNNFPQKEAKRVAAKERSETKAKARDEAAQII